MISLESDMSGAIGVFRDYPLKATETLVVE